LASRVVVSFSLCTYSLLEQGFFSLLCDTPAATSLLMSHELFFWWSVSHSIAAFKVAVFCIWFRPIPDRTLLPVILIWTLSVREYFCWTYAILW
jgi:hypothetical protein